MIPAFTNDWSGEIAGAGLAATRRGDHAHQPQPNRVGERFEGFGELYGIVLAERGDEQRGTTWSRSIRHEKHIDRYRYV